MLSIQFNNMLQQLTRKQSIYLFYFSFFLFRPPFIGLALSFCLSLSPCPSICHRRRMYFYLFAHAQFHVTLLVLMISIISEIHNIIRPCYIHIRKLMSQYVWCILGGLMDTFLFQFSFVRFRWSNDMDMDSNNIYNSIDIYRYTIYICTWTRHRTKDPNYVHFRSFKFQIFSLQSMKYDTVSFFASPFKSQRNIIIIIILLALSSLLSEYGYVVRQHKERKMKQFCFSMCLLLLALRN